MNRRNFLFNAALASGGAALTFGGFLVPPTGFDVIFFVQHASPQHNGFVATRVSYTLLTLSIVFSV